MQNAVCLPVSLANLQALDGNMLGRSSEGAFGPLRDLPALTWLNLGACGLAALPRQLSAVGALAALDLSHNKALGHAGEAAFSPLTSLPRLTRLDMGSCALERLPAAASALRSLADLSLRGNRGIGAGKGSGGGALQALCHLTALTSLDASDCGLQVGLPVCRIALHTANLVAVLSMTCSIPQGLRISCYSNQILSLVLWLRPA